ncbi:actin-binding protein WASF3-like [Antedon mediterranea]|uniref:actin-binding protein WASF3-like n=1 Tax=Antedon mediterranea TaxID=105859 RepID=UPI003AF6846C
MPLSLRDVKPVHVSRDAREMRDISKNLEHYKNFTLVNVIRQLSNLSAHAEDIFTSIHQEASDIFHRMHKLRNKVHKLSNVIDTLDPLVDDDDLEGALQKVPFYSNSTCDNNLMDITRRPKCVEEMYQRSEVMPDLECLTEFREDGKKSSDLYSNPKSFFDFWRSQQEKNLSSRGDKKRKSKYRPYKRIQPTIPLPCDRHKAMVQKKKALERKGKGRELEEIDKEHIRAEMAMMRDKNDNLSNGDNVEVYSELQILAPVDRSASIAGGLLNLLVNQGIKVNQEPEVQDETDVVAKLLQQQMELSDGEDVGWDDDEFDDCEDI